MIKDIFKPADILLPKDTSMEKWSVIACDQFSSEPSYWERVRLNVGDNPSTLKMIIPEVFLGATDEKDAISNITGVMDGYLKNGLFREITDSFIYIERTIGNGCIRRGLIGKIDLEDYEFSGGEAAILASEGTVLDRLPPRSRVRRAALLEFPHIIAFIDDKLETVIEPLSQQADIFPELYDFELMEGGGHIRGFRVHGDYAACVSSAIRKLHENNPALMIIGDGNHSLAAAKVCWDELKPNLSSAERENHPARFALLEVNNVYDPAISFEAIHRVMFGVDPQELLSKLRATLPDGCDYTLRWVSGAGSGEIGVAASCIGDMLSVLQDFLDDYTENTSCTIDYIHGEDSVVELSGSADRLGLILPAMDKSDFFETVTASGIFPRKSFSVGHARDKRYYLECRMIK